MSEQKFNIKKKGNFYVAFDTEDKTKSYGKINIKTGKFIGDTQCYLALYDYWSFNPVLTDNVSLEKHYQ